MPKSAEEILKEELDIDMDIEQRNWEKEYYEHNYRDILEFYTQEEKEVLKAKHEARNPRNQYNLFGDQVHDDEFDGEKLTKFVNKIIQKDQPTLEDYFDVMPQKGKKRKKLRSWYTPSVELSPRLIKITKKSFHELRRIADEQDLYYGFECAGFLYGKRDVIKKVKKYNCSASPGLVSGNPIDVFNQAKRKDYIGLFHSHLFNSSSMSGIDVDVLAGWTSYANMCNKPEPIMIIARSPRWKMKAWSMNAEFKRFENRLVII